MKGVLLAITYWDVILVTVPALLVCGVVYFLMNSWFKNLTRIRMMEMRGDQAHLTRPLKLQAYERLMLFCERVSTQNLILRVQSADMTARDLKSMLVMTIQQEFEYNLSQQLYISDKLWEIVKLAKNQLIEIITHVGTRVPAKASAEEFSQQLILFLASQNKDPIETAKLAIKRESSLLL